MPRSVSKDTVKSPHTANKHLTKNQKRKIRRNSMRLQSLSEGPVSPDSSTSNPSLPESCIESPVKEMTQDITRQDISPDETIESNSKVTKIPLSASKGKGTKNKSISKTDDTKINSKGKGKAKASTKIDDKNIISPTSSEQIEADISKTTDTNINSLVSNKQIEPDNTKETERQTTKTNDTNINSQASKEPIQQIDPQPSTSLETDTFEFATPNNYSIPEPSISHEAISLNTSATDVYSDPQPSTSNDNIDPPNIVSSKRVNLYAPDTGPQMYHAKGNIVTRPVITKNLPQVFQFLPVHGKPGPNTTLQEFYKNKLKEFVGCGLTDEEFDDLENYCSPEHLKTGNELKMQTNVPIMGLLNSNILHNNFSNPEMTGDPPNLAILKQNKVRVESEAKALYIKKLKYRGVRILPFTQELQQNLDAEESPAPTEPDVELEPGTDILYRVRIYRPFVYSQIKDRYTRSRHSVFCNDVLLTGRHNLTALRDRFNCHNDFDMRVDVSENPDSLPATKAKELFPSGFLFINNVFYVDTREGCIDYSEPIRQWAIKKKIGNFPKKDMCQVRLQDLVLKLGYPEVYVHQGNCEHVFIFSEIRLLNANDPLHFSKYPCSTAIAQNQSVYCTTCAEFSAKWIVVGSDRIPFDPGFFCDTCFKQYMYKDGVKIGNFKAYRYRGNAMNLLKPL